MADLPCDADCEGLCFTWLDTRACQPSEESTVAVTDPKAMQASARIVDLLAEREILVDLVERYVPASVARAALSAALSTEARDA